MRENNDVGVLARCNLGGVGVVDADDDTGSWRQDEEESGPTHSLSGRIHHRVHKVVSTYP